MNHNRYNITLLSDADEQQMKIDSFGCIELTRQCQLAPLNGTICEVAQQCWSEKLIGPFSGANRNNYDIRQPCNNSDLTATCDDTPTITAYLNSPQVRKYLNVDERFSTWNETSSEVGTTFITDGDWSMPFHEFVADMLDDGLRVLIYAGDADLMCNWIGNRAWTLELDWRGKDGYNAAEERAFVGHDPLLPEGGGIDAGVVRSFDNFAFVRVYDAGHMVPMDQPAVSLDLISKFLADTGL
ncbi:unnamed protein product [Phytophthora fragariaefolia]|uniref:Unnamed protein product n=1 Tax=Phytophthora fragariaefolia TaxID=1490495 RepID=A0A9W6YAD0_9STRA|nr:unnamed protein product [Phytophthora fragariaefolia]